MSNLKIVASSAAPKSTIIPVAFQFPDCPGVHCKNRQFEWTTASLLLWSGIFILLWPNALLSSAFAPILDAVPYSLLGTIFVVAGTINLVALWHNGHWPIWGPIVRAACVVVGFVALLSMDVALIRQVLEVGRAPSPGIPVYTVLAASQFLAIFRAADDVRRL
jgi:hypothetical protein